VSGSTSTCRTQPVRRLDGFQRITLAPGQAKTVTFTLGPGSIGFCTSNPGQFTVEPGAVDVYVGDSSRGGLHGQFTEH
jgi:beta-glucosidase